MLALVGKANKMTYHPLQALNLECLKWNHMGLGCTSNVNNKLIANNLKYVEILTIEVFTEFEIPV
jgi:hypothetical protein